MEVLSLVSLLIFFERVLYEKIPAEMLFLLFLPLINLPFLRSFLFIAMSFLIVRFRTKRKSYLIFSVILPSLSILIVGLTKPVYLLYPLKFAFSLCLSEKVHILISALLIFLSYRIKEKAFLSKKHVLISFILLFLLFFKIKKFLYPEEVYKNPFLNNSFICVQGNLVYNGRVLYRGKIYNSYSICKENCIYFVSEKEVEENIICGYAHFKRGKVYLKMAREFQEWTS